MKLFNLTSKCRIFLFKCYLPDFKDLIKKKNNTRSLVLKVLVVWNEVDTFLLFLIFLENKLVNIGTVNLFCTFNFPTSNNNFLLEILMCFYEYVEKLFNQISICRSIFN